MRTLAPASHDTVDFLGERAGPEGAVQRVRVKCLARRYARDPEVRRHFVREAKFALSLNHPSIERVIEFGEEAGGVYLAVELVEGPTLAMALDHVRAQKRLFPNAVAAHVALSLADVLARLHRRSPPIVHRAISTRFILLGNDGSVVLGGLALAKALGDSTHTKAGFFDERAGSLSPELAREEAAGPASDFFSLGCTLYELLAQEPPFRGDTALATRLAVAAGAHRPLEVVAPKAHPALHAIVAQLLAADASKRLSDPDLLVRLLSPLRSTRAREDAGALARSVPVSVPDADLEWADTRVTDPDPVPADGPTPFAAHVAEERASGLPMPAPDRPVAPVVAHAPAELPAEPKTTPFTKPLARAPDPARTAPAPKSVAPPPEPKPSRKRTIAIGAIAIAVGVLCIVLMLVLRFGFGVGAPTDDAATAPVESDHE